jgi:FixJ family two-component response regulator
MTKARPLIAVVDDEQSVCVALQRLVRSAGMDVETYSSGEEFLQAVQTHQFDCVLLDLHMPKVNGHEVLSRLTQFRLVYRRSS